MSVQESSFIKTLHPRRRFDLQLFADGDGGERQEPATPKKRQEARRRGQVFRSAELSSAFVLLGTLVGIQFLGGGMAETLYAYVRGTLGSLGESSLTIPEVERLTREGLGVLLQTALPLLGLAAASGAVVGAAQAGGVVSFEPLTPKLSNINPAQGWKRIFSLRSVVELLKSLLKIGILGLLVYWTLSAGARQFPELARLELFQAVALVANLFRTLFWRAAIAFLVIGLADFFYQKWEFERGLRMSKEEVKREFKETEGDPQIRAQRRRRQQELARQRMLADVARADVVITNPTHYAVALRYDPATMGAPTVLAKGKNFLAQRIKEIARENDVVVMEDRWLARSLYRSVKVGQAVPEELYQAVAEVLAFVWRLKNRRL